ncbi:MAG TPA: hypothetical protein G4O08_09255 [Anaerolineae bacterium]|nr:hypothetical protein [Anaerolineae bacterium]
MQASRSPNHGSLLAAAILLAVGGWLGLWLVVNYTLPTIGSRWMFFLLLTLAVSGSVLPLVWLLHRRFGGPRPAPAGVLLRQGLWAGLLASLCVWLQINRNLTLPLAFVLGASLFALEWLLRLLERSSRRPMR